MRRLFICAIALFLLAGCAERPGITPLRRGIRAVARGKYVEGITLLQRSLSHLEANNERAIAYNGLGIACHKLGRDNEALEAFESAAAANPSAFEPFYNLGVVNLKLGNEDKAVACFEKASLLNQETGRGSLAGEHDHADKDTRALEFLAVIYCQRRQWDDARRILGEAEKSSGQSVRILTALATVEFKANNTNQALEYLQKALEQDQHYAPAIYNLAVINRLVLNDSEQALPLLTEYARVAPAGPRRDQTCALINEIKKAAAAAEAAEAASNAAANAAVSQSQPEPKPQPEKKSQPEQKAEGATAANKTSSTVTNAIQTAPTLPSFEELMEVAKTLELQGRREAAFNNYLRIARAAEQAGSTGVKNQALRHAMSLTDGNPRASYDLGNYFIEKNRKEDALTCYKSAAGQNSDAHLANLATARLALEKGDYDAAIITLKKADQLQPDDPEALWILGNLYDQSLGMTNAAQQAYTRFVKRFPNDRRTAALKDRIVPMEGNAANDKPEQKKRRSFFERIFK